MVRLLENLESILRTSLWERRKLVRRLLQGLLNITTTTHSSCTKSLRFLLSPSVVSVEKRWLDASSIVKRWWWEGDQLLFVWITSSSTSLSHVRLPNSFNFSVQFPNPRKSSRDQHSVLDRRSGRRRNG